MKNKCKKISKNILSLDYNIIYIVLKTEQRYKHIYKRNIILNECDKFINTRKRML